MAADYEWRGAVTDAEMVVLPQTGRNRSVPLSSGTPPPASLPTSPFAFLRQDCGVAVECMWRGPVSDAEMVALVESHGGNPVAGWWDRIRPHSLGWVTARDGGELVGFVNVAWDGGDHAFLLDTKTAGPRQHQGIATAVVRVAVEHAKQAGCEWLHVDFTPALGAFYFDACGFRPTDAGLMHLASL